MTQLPQLFGVFGGTFDPIHLGHLDTVDAVRKQCGLGQIHFVPSAAPPHRDIPSALPQQRLEMVTLAIAGFPHFIVDDREFRRNGPSYTYDTLSALVSEKPDCIPCFILGVDALLGVEQWYRWQEVLGLAHFIVMERPGWQSPNPLPQWWMQARVESSEELLQQRGGLILEVQIEPRAVSATEIRYGIARGIDVSSMLPMVVWEYIQDHNLYRMPEE